MSAQDSLGIQFHAKVTADTGVLNAMHGGQRVGQIVWRAKDAPIPLGPLTLSPGYTPRAGEIFGIDVHENYRRQGIATELLHRAAQIEPRLHHGQGVSPAGVAFIAKHPEYGPGRPGSMVEG